VIVKTADYTIEKFGIEQARRYRDGLEICFQTLADTTMVGRSAAAFAPELRRYEIQSNVVFYRPEYTGAFIVRVLHESRDFPRRLQTDIKIDNDYERVRQYCLITVSYGSLEFLHHTRSSQSK